MSDTSRTAVPDGSADGSTPPAGSRGIDALAARFVVLADDDFAGYSPIYERLARAIADDEASLALLLDAAPIGRTPVLALAAVHDMVLAEPDSLLARIYAGQQDTDPWPPFRTLLHDRTGEVLERMRTRRIQTNEVGRSAVLLPALATVRDAADARGDGRPLALVEVGPSAGLNLLLDRYAVTYRRGEHLVGTAGQPDSTVQLTCELRGPTDPPIRDDAPAIATRVGIDISPVDVTDEAARRWLSACVWPGVPDRPERLAAAIAVALQDPPPLVAGDAVTDLAPLVAGLPDDVLPVVVSTWAIAYVGRDGRAALLAALDELGARRDLALLTAEEPHVTPWIPEVSDEVRACGDAEGDGSSTLLGLRTWHSGCSTDEALGICHPHGRWLAWAPPTGGS